MISSPRARERPTSTIVRLSAAIPLVLAVACASQGGTSGAGGGAGGGGAGGGGGSAATPEHRPAPLRCEPAGGSTGAGGSAAGGASGGSGACTTDADCSVDGGAALPFCLAGACSRDQCLADENCAAGSVCGCSTQVVGLTPHVNSCLPSSCRTDADCPDTGLCSPARGGHCGSPSGYHCRTSADTCRTDADCPSHPSNPAGGPYVYRSCDYALELGRWQCVVVTPCGG